MVRFRSGICKLRMLDFVQNVILKFSLVISLECYKDTDIEALVPASVSHHCLVLSCPEIAHDIFVSTLVG